MSFFKTIFTNITTDGKRAPQLGGRARVAIAKYQRSSLML